MEDMERRRFIKFGLIGIAGLMGALAPISFDRSEGFKIREVKDRVNFGAAEAQAKCGMSYECSGGGGNCGMSYSCSGGGGKCGMSYECSGGGNKCGMSYNCSGR